MPILITGANGQLGRSIHHILSHTPHTEEYIFTDITTSDVASHTLDITDRAAIEAFVQTHGIRRVVNCAAYTNVDLAERDVDSCNLLNHIAVCHLSEAMKAVDGTLFHISTDYVFGGEPTNTPCPETRRGTPIGVYGSTKLRGEEAIRASGCRHLIVRTSWLYSPYGKNFVKTMLTLTAERPELRVVIDQCGTPTSALDLAQALVERIERGDYEGHEGTYHYSNEGVTSWYDFAIAIARRAHHNTCTILPCRSEEYPSPVQRPAYSVLDKTKWKTTFHTTIPHWTDSLDICLNILLNAE